MNLIKENIIKTSPCNELKAWLNCVKGKRLYIDGEPTKALRDGLIKLFGK